MYATTTRLRTPHVGDIVTYTTHLGTRRTVRVNTLGVEGGRPVFDGRLLGARDDDPDANVWGYFHQIICIN